MDIVLSIDCARGKCWTALQSLQLHNFNSLHTDNWSKALQLIETESVALLLCNLDIPQFQADQLFNLLCKLKQVTPQKSLDSKTPIPVLVFSEHNEKWDQFTVDQLSQIELCPASANLDYVKSRLSHYLSRHNVLEQQAKDLDKLRNRTDVFLANASDGVIQYDDVGSIQYANSKALSILGYEQPQLLAANVFDLICTSDDQSANTDQLKQQIHHAMLQELSYEKRVHLRTNTQSAVVAEIKCNPVFDDRGEVESHLMLFQDITARTLNEQRLIKLSKYDVLTGLSNRSKYHSFTEGKIAYCTHNKKKLALLFIDIDHFKNINDSMGHDAGDELLVEVAKRLLTCVRESDLVARIGGDEFAITLLDMGNPTQVTRIVNNILKVITRPFLVQGREINVSASIGISLFPENGSDLSTLTKTADTAMYQAKIDGRNTYRFFSCDIQNRVMEQNNLEVALRKAISRDEFSMHYQPQVDAVSGRIVGLEALIRWQHPDWPNIGPDRFIPVAEECGLLPALGKWVLYSACRQAMKWREDEEINFDYPVAVNLSPKQLVNGDFIDLLDKVLRDTGLPPENLVLELTETAVMHNPDVAITTLGTINETGVKISVDDFGTGYSSLNYLKKLPINKLKIDRSFVKDIGIDQNGEAIVTAILALAHSLNLLVVAEGVEEQSHVDFLREQSCDQLQGYFFSRPLSVEDINEMLRREKATWGSSNPKIGGPAPVNEHSAEPPIH